MAFWINRVFAQTSVFLLSQGDVLMPVDVNHPGSTQLSTGHDAATEEFRCDFFPREQWLLSNLESGFLKRLGVNLCFAVAQTAPFFGHEPTSETTEGSS